MSVLFNFLLEDSMRHKKLIENLNAKILKYPDYNLVMKKDREKTSFYVNNKYLSRKEISKIKSLLQKRYEIKILRTLKIEKKAIDDCLKKITGKKDSLMDEIIETFPQDTRKLVLLSEETDKGFINKWMRTEFIRKLVDEKYNFFTKKNERVRSKTEVIIADRLNDAGVPYHYEKMILIDNCIPFYPDFTVLNVSRRKEYIWEHFGMMGNNEYSQKAVLKINTYLRNGYVQGKNLIMTFESSENQISTKIIDSMINEFLL